METLSFSIKINAPKEKVWATLWNDSTYREWTAVFTPGSYAESNWEKGGKVRFLSPKGDGMYGIIEERIDNEQMTFKHLGEIKNGNEEPREWGGARESYYLQGTNGVTELTAHMDAAGDFSEYLSKTFPQALEAVKEISER